MTPVRFHKVFPIFLTVIIVSLYIPGINYSFLHFWDNEGFSYIEGNKLLSSFSIENLKQIFTAPFDNHYHPLTLISLGIDYQINGEHPLVFRITNLLLFISISIFIFYFIKRLTGSFYAAAFISLFYAVHPFNVESVMWLSERKNLLFVFFLIPALSFYLKYLYTGDYRFVWLSAIFFLLSLFSKSQGLPFAGLVFILDFIRNRKVSIRLITEKLPIIVAAGLFLYLTFYFHQPENFVRAHPSGISDYFFAGFRNLFFYTGHSIVPLGLSAYYPYPDSESLISVFWYYPILFLIALFIVYRYFRNNRLFLAGIAFFVISILPLLKFVPVPFGNYIAADRYMLLPLIGIGICLWAVFDMASEKYRAVLKYPAAAMLIVFCIISFSLSKVWKNDVSFYSSLIEKHPGLKSALGNRGRVYMAEGKFEKAIDDFTQLIHIAPEYPNAYLNRGLAYIRADKPAKAYYDFSAAVQFDPSNYKAYNNRALLLMNMKQFPEAKADILKALEIKPDFTEAWVNRSLIEVNSGEKESALNSLNRAIEAGFGNNEIIKYIKEQAITAN